MVFAWLSGGEDVASLIAKKSYGKAAKVLRTQLEADPENPSVRQQLADVLVLDGKNREAFAILTRLADEYAINGFVGKAIAVLKKIQRVDPGQGVDEKLTRLLKEREKESSHRAALRLAAASRRELVASAEAVPDEEEEPAPVAPTAAPPEAPVPAAAEPEPEFEIEIETEAAAAAAADGRSGITATPLFSDFSADELLEVIRGLQLVSFEPGDVIVAEGEPGDSLFVLTTGSVKAFVKDPAGHCHKVREMREGDFFGEVSILTGKPRSATLTAASPCELLVLDQESLDGITKRQPNVRSILWDFCESRIANAGEVMIRKGGNDPRGS